MYYPYLRGKQYELLALRDFSSANKNCQTIVPIIEPVKSQMNGLNMAISAMLANGMKFAVIINPMDGDFKHPNVNNDIVMKLTTPKDDRDQWIPAYLYNNCTDKILRHAENHHFNDLMIVFPSGVDVNNDMLMSFLANNRIAHVVTGNLSSNRFVRGRLLKLNKNIISLEDRFQDKVRNADYANSLDEQFSEDFAFYREDRLAGFSDYTILAKDFTEGGMLPYAIAIHLTYQKSEDQIYVHHFVSDSNFDQSNIRGKFYEAAAKIAPFYNAGRYLKTSSVKELIERSISNDGFPGLGYIKKLSVKNHLELINQILSDTKYANMR